MKSVKRIVNMLPVAIALVIVSCSKQADTAATTDTTIAATSTSTSIAVAKSATGTDSIYVVNVCDHNSVRETIAFSSLPAAVLVYLSASYSGYTGQKAVAIKDTLATVTGFVVIVQFNGKPVGIKFDAAGNFIKVLEQREGHDLQGGGWHSGGCFDNRDHLGRDTIALSALPAAIITYFATNYPQDTLTHAFKNRDSSIVVLSVNNGVYSTLFDAGGNFIQRITLPCGAGGHSGILQSALPANVQTYLSATYPNYVFKHAFVVQSGQTAPGYVVFIDANNTKYAVEFDASGNFVKAVTVR